MEDACKKLEGSHEVPALKETVENLALVMINYMDLVMRDIVMASISAAGGHSGREANSREWGSKKLQEKAAGSTGTSSRMSTVTKDAEGVEQKFEDNTGETVTFPDECEQRRLKLRRLHIRRWSRRSSKSTKTGTQARRDHSWIAARRACYIRAQVRELLHTRYLCRDVQGSGGERC